MPVPVWDHRDAASATLRMTLDPALRPFQGHFPQAAILPGVAQLDWAVRFGRQAFACRRVPAHGCGEVPARGPPGR
jgi:hypothetical protein